MPKKAGIVFVSLGAVLILSALLLFLYNARQDALAGQEAEAALSQLRTVIAQRAEEAEPMEKTQATQPPVETAPEETTEPPEMTVVTIGIYGYIGYVSIPAIEIDLPVMDQWDEKRLNIAPCRQFGSVFTDDLVIAAHNYPNHFGKLSSLHGGDTVIFTDMEGRETVYAVVRMETVDPTHVETVRQSGCDLVLYTCTRGGADRVAVFCDRVEE